MLSLIDSLFYSFPFSFRLSFAHFPSLWFFSFLSCKDLLHAAFHDLDMSNDEWPNFRLNKWLSSNPNFDSVGFPVSVSKFANLIRYASRAAMFRSVMPSLQQISFTECDTGLPYRFGPWFLVCLLVRLMAVGPSSWCDSSEKPDGWAPTIVPSFDVRIYSASFRTLLVRTCSASSSHFSGSHHCSGTCPEFLSRPFDEWCVYSFPVFLWSRRVWCSFIIIRLHVYCLGSFSFPCFLRCHLGWTTLFVVCWRSCIVWFCPLDGQTQATPCLGVFWCYNSLASLKFSLVVLLSFGAVGYSFWSNWASSSSSDSISASSSFAVFCSLLLGSSPVGLLFSNDPFAACALGTLDIAMSLFLYTAPAADFTVDGVSAIIFPLSGMVRAFPLFRCSFLWRKILGVSSVSLFGLSSINPFDHEYNNTYKTLFVPISTWCKEA